MKMLGKRALAFLLRQNGQALGEYSLLISFIAVLLMVMSVVAFRDAVYSLWQSAVVQMGP